MSQSHLVYALVCSTLLLLSSSACTRGSEDQISLQNCPICGHTFLVINGMLEGWSPGVDRWEGTGAVNPEPLVSCPYCLYSAFKSDFPGMSQEEKEELREALSAVSLSMTQTEKQLVNKDIKQYERVLIGILARHCYGHRRKQEGLGKTVYWLFRETSPWGSLAPLHDRYRDELITILSRDRTEWPVEAPTRSYLLGVLSRQRGEMDPARGYFARARSQLRYPAWSGQDRDGNLAEAVERQDLQAALAGLSIKQLRMCLPLSKRRNQDRVNAADTIEEFALMAIVQHPDRNDADRVLTEYVDNNVTNLCVLTRLSTSCEERARQIPQIREWFRGAYSRANDGFKKQNCGLPGMWEDIYMRLENNCDAERAETLLRNLADMTDEGVFSVYRIRSGENWTSVVQRLNLSEERVSDLKRQLGGTDITESREVRLIKVPAGWDEPDTMETLAHLLKVGSEPAARYFGVLCSNLYLYSETETPLGFAWCMSALADRPELVPVVRQYRGSPQNRVQRISYACMDYWTGDASRTGFLLDQLSEEWQVDDALLPLLVHSFAVRPSDKARTLILTRDWSSPRAEFQTVELVCHYLQLAGRHEDADTLGVVATSCADRLVRSVLERSMRRIRIRLLKIDASNNEKQKGDVP